MNRDISSIKTFKENWLEKHPNEKGVFCHNLYHLVSEDMDGNVTDEKYGINCMTDYGFERSFVYSNGGQPHIFIGTSTAIPTPSSQQMTSPITNTAAYGTGDTWSLTLTAEDYDSNTGITTVTFRMNSGYFDYTQFSEEKTITEIGVGNQVDQLWFHARVYDASGNPSSIIKRMNERLTISIYLSGGMKVKQLVEDAWSNGVYKLITPKALLFPSKDNFSNSLYLFMAAYHNSYTYSTSIGQITNQSHASVSGSILTCEYTNMGSYLMEDKYRYIDDVFIGDNQYAYTTATAMITKPRLSSPMTLVSENIYTGPRTNSFAESFAKCPYNNDHEKYFTGEFPVIDVDMKSSYMYDYTDHDWSIQDTFTNPTTSQYDSGYLVHSIIDTGYFASSDSYRTFSVFLNPYPNIPITKIYNRNATFYATDEWWDTSSWVLIDNPAAVDSTLQGKKYYCSFTTSFTNEGIDGYGGGSRNNYRTIKIERNMAEHSLTNLDPEVIRDWGESSSAPSGYITGNRTGKMITSDDYGYIASYGMLVYPESTDPNATGGTGASPTLPYRYFLKDAGDQFPYNEAAASLIWNTSRGSKIAIFSRANASHTPAVNDGFVVYEVSATPSVAPTSTSYLFAANFSSNPAYTTTDNGFVIASYISGSNNQNRTYILAYDVTGMADELYYVDGYERAFCIDLTDYMCGHDVNVSDHERFDIYDMKNKTVIKSFDLPSGYTYSGGCGFDDFVYIRVLETLTSSYKTYIYYISTERLELLDFSYLEMEFTDNLERHCILSIAANGVNTDACMVILGTHDNGNYHHVIKSSDPTHPIALAYWLSQGDAHWGDWLSQKKATLKYINNKQLILSMTVHNNTNTFTIAYDIGHILDHGRMERVPFMTYSNMFTMKLTTSGLYKDKMITFKPQSQSSSSPYKYNTLLIMEPIERYVPHKVTIETRTINAYNNPVRVSKVKKFEYQASNDTSIFDPPT